MGKALEKWKVSAKKSDRIKLPVLLSLTWCIMLDRCYKMMGSNSSILCKMDNTILRSTPNRRSYAVQTIISYRYSNATSGTQSVIYCQCHSKSQAMGIQRGKQHYRSNLI